MSDPAQTSTTAITSVNPFFKLVFLSMLVLTVSLVLLNVVLAVFVTQTDTAKDLAKHLQEAWQSGITAMIGLLGGKALS